MPKIKPNILVVDDEESMLKAYNSLLKNFYNLTLVNDSLEALKVFKKGTFNLVLLDLMMPEMTGLELLQKIRGFDQQTEIVMVTAINDLKQAVQAIKLGAYNYLTKPFEADDLISNIEKCLERQSLSRENVYLKELVAEKGGYFTLIGKSVAMRKVFEIIEKIAGTDSTVLITGESGTGKELVAHAVHHKSKRSEKPFVVVNCAAIADLLIESELFGHEKGSFTGAIERQLGKFELANGGTIFLDEIGCMKPALQAKLLRVLQDGVIQRVGGQASIQVDVRLVAATNLNLEQAVKEGNFRQDLYYRLNVIRLGLPALRQRKSDIPILVNHFLQKYNRELHRQVKGFSSEALAFLSQYDWPGNVRELQNLVERIVALSDDKAEIRAEALPLENVSHNVIKKSLKAAELEFERRYIKNALLDTDGNQTKAAKILGINRTTLIAKMKQAGMK